MTMRPVPLMAVMLVGLATGASADVHVGAALVSTDSEFRTAVDTLDPDDSGWKVYAGFNIFKLLDLEASYRDLGHHADTSGTSAIDVDIESIDVAVRGILPLGKALSVFARIGYANVSTDGSLDVGGLVSDIDDDDWEPIYGVGVELRLARRLGLRAEWEEYDVAESLSSFSVGAFLRF